MYSVLPFAIALIVIASLFRLAFMYHALYVLLGLYLGAHFWSQRASQSISFRRSYPERAFLNETIHAQLEVQNRGLLPVPWLRIHERLPLNLASPPYLSRVVTLGPRQKHTFTYELVCRQRGYYTIGPLTATTGDLFGLFERQIAFPSGVSLTVYPQIVPLQELGLPSKSPFGHLKTKEPLYEDPARVVGVRDYTSGDSLRNINWKTSASAGRLQVKKYEPAMTLQTVMLLNLSLADFERQHAYYASEMGIVVAASIASHLNALRQEVGLITTGRDPAAVDDQSYAGVLPRKGRDQVTRILELLGRIEQRESAPFAEVIRQASLRFPWGATLVVITPRETDVLLETLLSLKRSGFSVTIIYVDYPSQFSFERAERRASSLGMRCYRVWKEADFDVWRHRWRT